MLTGLNHLTLAVTDVDRSLDFYRDLLGFVPHARWQSGAYLSLGELWLCLSLDAARSPGKALSGNDVFLTGRRANGAVRRRARLTLGDKTFEIQRRAEVVIVSQAFAAGVLRQALQQRRLLTLLLGNFLQQTDLLVGAHAGAVHQEPDPQSHQQRQGCNGKRHQAVLANT